VIKEEPEEEKKEEEKEVEKGEGDSKVETKIVSVSVLRNPDPKSYVKRG
jgi:hypothetical protein